jgi:hypothetical protein
MSASDDSTSPSRFIAVVGRLMMPWERRHLYAVAGMRFTAGGFNLGIGTVLVGLGRRAETVPDRRKCYRWGTFFLVSAVVQVLGGWIDTAVARSGPPRT